MTDKSQSARNLQNDGWRSGLRETPLLHLTRSGMPNTDMAMSRGIFLGSPKPWTTWRASMTDTPSGHLGRRSLRSDCKSGNADSIMISIISEQIIKRNTMGTAS